MGCKGYLVGERVKSIKNWYLWGISHIGDHNKKKMRIPDFSLSEKGVINIEKKKRNYN